MVAIDDRHFTVTDDRYHELDRPVGLRLPLASLHLFPNVTITGGNTMRKSLLVAGLSAAILLTNPASAQTLNVATAGDQNMVDYIKDYLGPMFEKSIRASRSWPSAPARRRRLAEDLREARRAEEGRTATSDFDVVVIHQKAAGTMVKDELIKKYRDTLPTGNLVTRDTATNSLGADVSGYVMPMFHSQTAIAYNPDLVKSAPNSYAELREWVKKNPKQFGYNGIKGGMSGVAFVTGWVSAFGGDAAKLEQGSLRRGDQGHLGQVAWPTSRSSTRTS